MTPPGNSPANTAEARPLDFRHWLESRGMNPNRKRPPGRTMALLMDYRAYLVLVVGKENAGQWFTKYAGPIEAGEPAEKAG